MAAYPYRGKSTGLLREGDWSSWPLGSIDEWPGRLRMAVALCLSSGLARLVW